MLTSNKEHQSSYFVSDISDISNDGIDVFVKLFIL